MLSFIGCTDNPVMNTDQQTVETGKFFWDPEPVTDSSAVFIAQLPTCIIPTTPGKDEVKQIEGEIITNPVTTEVKNPGDGTEIEITEIKIPGE
jgi:hypothetical protein